MLTELQYGEVSKIIGANNYRFASLDAPLGDRRTSATAAVSAFLSSQIKTLFSASGVDGAFLIVDFKRHTNIENNFVLIMQKRGQQAAVIDPTGYLTNPEGEYHRLLPQDWHFVEGDSVFYQNSKRQSFPAILVMLRNVIVNEHSDWAQFDYESLAMREKGPSRPLSQEPAADTGEKRKRSPVNIDDLPGALSVKHGPVTSKTSDDQSTRYNSKVTLETPEALTIGSHVGAMATEEDVFVQDAHLSKEDIALRDMLSLMLVDPSVMQQEYQEYQEAQTARQHGQNSQMLLRWDIRKALLALYLHKVDENGVSWDGNPPALDCKCSVLDHLEGFSTGGCVGVFAAASGPAPYTLEQQQKQKQTLDRVRAAEAKHIEMPNKWLAQKLWKRACGWKEAPKDTLTLS